MSGPGTIYYTLDGTDPRAVGGATAGTVYSGPIALRESTRVKARAKNGQWSALHEAVFSVEPARETFSPTRDWTAEGVTTLVVDFRGAPENAGQLYVKTDGALFVRDVILVSNDGDESPFTFRITGTVTP
jgi:hypothetical protein